MPSGQIGVEIDEAARLVMVAYIGPVTDAQVLAFYRGLVADKPQVARYDFLIDLSFSGYVPSPASVQALGELARSAGGGNNRIAAVRRERPELYAATDGRPMLEVFGADNVRFFNDLVRARAWISMPAQGSVD